mgnify:CR=1 FL=1|jgi:hypothetical protein
MGTISYLFERIASLTFIVPCVWSAMHHRGRFVHLTWWSLVVHALYFNVDKASTPATLVARVLHATSYCGAFAVAVGYTLLVLGGSSHAGGWHAWEKKVEVHRLVSQGGSPDDCDPGTVCQAPLWYTAGTWQVHPAPLVHLATWHLAGTPRPKKSSSTTGRLWPWCSTRG